MYVFAMLMSCSSFNYHGENYVGNNNYEQLTQLNSQIETKHIASSNTFCKGFELFFPQKYFSIYICKHKIYFQFESYIISNLEAGSLK